MMPVVNISQPTSARAFTKTEALSRSNHPDRASNWPAWAVAAFQHTLGASHLEDMFVTYVADVRPFAAEPDRNSIMGIEIGVCALYYWDWGPIPTALDTNFVVAVVSTDEFAAA